MLYIKKDLMPKKIQEQVIKIEKTEEWKGLNENDTKGIRACFDSLDKELIRTELVKEQHGLCAYCMRKIDDSSSTTIEHFRPIRNKLDALNYNNMLACCDGGRNSKGTKVLCCDASKGDQEITFGPFDESFINSLRYTKDGYIYTCPKNADAEHDINDILRLNGIRDEKGCLKYDTATQLVAGRKHTYRNYSLIMEKLDKKAGGNQVKMAMSIRKLISQLESQDTYQEYTGMLLYLLKNRLKR